MKLLLQRSLTQRLEGPFWVESAYLDATRLHAFLIIARDRGESNFEPRFSPEGKIYWISDKEDIPKVFTEDKPQALTHRATFKFAFQGQRLITLECEDEESPYLLNGTISLDSSLTHLEPIPESEDWLVSSLNQLYRGPIDALMSLGPTPTRRFTTGPDCFYYTSRHQLIQQSYTGQAEPIFACQKGSLAYPLYTPMGILVTQEDCPEHHLWLVDAVKRTATSIWSCCDERVYACSALYQAPK